MLNFNEMVKCEREYAYNKKQMLIDKYTAFIDYLKKVILITFEDNKEQIISYLNELNNKSLLLNWCTGGIHYDGFCIKADDKTLNVISLRAHDSHYDPILNLDHINNDNLLSFFEKEYNDFLMFVPCYDMTDLNNVNKYVIDESDSIVCMIVNKFNEVCYNNFKEHFYSLGIDNVYSFIESKFSLKFTDERRRELDKEVYEEYNSYNEKHEKIMKKFNESVKDLK